MATEVSSYDRDSQPYSNIGLISVTFPDGSSFHGTCSLIGQNDILTATHMVYDPDHGGWADSYDFYFGADYNSQTGQFEDYGFEYTPSQWNVIGWPDQTFTDDNNDTMIKSETQFDIALIGVGDPIGDSLGWLGLSSGYNGTYLTEAIGYPGDTTGMMHESVYITENSYFEIYESDYDVMGPGSSGGPLLVDNYVIGVKSTGSWWADIGFVYDKIIEEMEENNSLLEGSGIPSDDYLNGTLTTGLINVDSRVTGKIEKADDEDWFAIAFQAGLNYQIDLEGNSTSEGTLTDPYLRGIYYSGKEGVDLIENTVDDDSGIGLNSQLQFRPDYSGTYYIAAGAAGKAGTGTYTLSATLNDDYANLESTTGFIVVNGQTTGTIEISNDEDWFSVSLLAGQAYQIDLEGAPTSQGSLSDPCLNGIYFSDGKSGGW